MNQVLEFSARPISEYACFLDTVGVMDGQDWQLLNSLIEKNTFVYAVERNQSTGRFYTIHFIPVKKVG